MNEFDELVGIMARLRSDTGCPWDRQQTSETLKAYLLEETYEVLEAVDGGDPQKLCAELGDLLLQIIFHAQIASEAGGFDVRDVLNRISEKLVFRHPHVFGDVEVADADEVLVNWEQLKCEERDSGRRESALDGVPHGMPALQRAYKLQKKAARVGFDWDAPAGAAEKVEEERAELQEAAQSADPSAVAAELGDLLFAVVNYGRLLKVDGEDALRTACNRFEQRFRAMEQKAGAQGRQLQDLELEQMDELWGQVKAELRGEA